ncbi:MAG: patatin-like phospholipase family protein [Chitinophagaceae bacterium]|nr:patatin-like phospholipase family protein [Chitinophagaceae bacterium]
MIKILNAIWYSLPVQLLVLHFRKHQFILLFWYVLFATISSNFLENFGADTLFLAPEYFNQVSVFSTAIVGFTFGIFFMSWNITTFILNSNLIRFLVTNTNPFLKYCLNNSLLPIILSVYYIIKTIGFEKNQELLTTPDLIWLVLSFIGGLTFSILIALAYFFSADKTIYYSLGNQIKSANEQYLLSNQSNEESYSDNILKVKWFLSTRFKIRKPRNIEHYSEEFLVKVLSHNHISAVLAILIAFIFLVGLGFISDEKLFQIPAASSILIFFSILIAVIGAITIFFKTWTLVILTLIYFGVNFLFSKNIVDPRNKAYGLVYKNLKERPLYNRASIQDLASEQNIKDDKEYYLQILNNWKAKQKESLPIMYVINTSGGGLRSTTFTMHTLAHLDSMFKGSLMDKTLFITGASGGMLGATYYRELFYRKNKDIAHTKKFVDNITNDLLNPIFSSFISRDIIGPVQKFKYNGLSYTKDRGYAFEEQLNINTEGILNKQLKDYIEPEKNAKIPFILFSAVITQDARKLIIASHPARFLMKPNIQNKQISSFDADAIDFTSFFKKQHSTNLRLLSALRMNATYPYILPSVWLPSEPVIDVMDAGIRDNYGIETTLRFLNVFEDWIKTNTKKVVIIQIRDREQSDWVKPKPNDYFTYLTQPFAQLQENWFNLQDYYQAGQINYASSSFKDHLQTICWQYSPTQENARARLSFHLTKAEKNEIAKAVFNRDNVAAFKTIQEQIK